MFNWNNEDNVMKRKKYPTVKNFDDSKINTYICTKL